MMNARAPVRMELPGGLDFFPMKHKNPYEVLEKCHSEQAEAKPVQKGAEKVENKKKKRNRRKGASTVNQEIKGAGLEEFLLSKMGENSGLDVDVVRDIIQQCSGDPQKSMNALLHLIPDQFGAEKHPLDNDKVGETKNSHSHTGAASTKIHKDEGSQKDQVTQLHTTTKGKESSFQVLFNQVLSQEHARIQKDVHRLRCNFPGVDISMIEEILKANENDYDSAVKYLAEAGYTPITAEKDGVAPDSPAFEQDVHRLSCTFPKVAPLVLQEILISNRCDYRTAVKCLTDAGLNPVTLPGTRTEPLREDIVKRPEVTDPPDGEKDDWRFVKGKSKTKKQTNTTPQPEATNGAFNYDSAFNKKSAAEHWFQMKNYYSEASAAYSSGQRSLAGVLSDKARECKKRAIEERAKESDKVFHSRNLVHNNTITIDLHNLLVEEAVRIVDLHLTTLPALKSVHTLIVITGHGKTTPSGKPRVKPAIIGFLNRKQLKWTETNPGCLRIDLRSVKCS